MRYVNNLDHPTNQCQCTHKIGLKSHGQDYILTMLYHDSNRWSFQMDRGYISYFSCHYRTLTSIFSVHSLPEVLAIDNVSYFASAEFQEFIQHNDIHHIHSSPYHPASNGQVECAVKVIKDACKRASKQSLERELSKFLFLYKLTPHTTLP